TWLLFLGRFRQPQHELPGSANLPDSNCGGPRIQDALYAWFHLGLQREITGNTVIQADYYHRDIRNMLGVRTTNLACEARLPGHASELQPGTGARPILTYGSWYQGRFDSFSAGIRKRMSRRFTTEAFYTWTHAIDNALRSSFVSDVQTGLGAGVLGGRGPTDSFVGVPPL